MTLAAPRCEACRREPATTLSWFPDPKRWAAPRSGTWKIVGACTAEVELYWIALHGARGWYASERVREEWRRHLREKRWFDERDFDAMLRRLAAAPRVARPKGRLAERRRPNVKPPAGRLREPQLEPRA